MPTFWKKSGKIPIFVLTLPQTRLFFFPISSSLLSKNPNQIQKKPTDISCTLKTNTTIFKMISRMLAERAVLTELMSSSTPFLHAAGYRRDCSVTQRPYAAL